MITGFVPGLPMRAGYLRQQGVTSSSFLVPSGALIHLDFANNLYWANSQFVPVNSICRNDTSVASFTPNDIISGEGFVSSAATARAISVHSAYISPLLDGDGLAVVIKFKRASGFVKVFTQSGGIANLGYFHTAPPRIEAAQSSINLTGAFFIGSIYTAALNFVHSGSTIEAVVNAQSLFTLVASAGRPSKFFINVFDARIRTATFYPRQISSADLRSMSVNS